MGSLLQASNEVLLASSEKAVGVIASLAVDQGAWYAIPDWWMVIGAWLALASVWFVWWQTKADHNRSRRERALELMDGWVSHPDSCSIQHSLARKLLQQLTKEQCEELYDYQTIEFKAGQLPILKAFRLAFTVESNGSKTKASLDSTVLNEAEIVVLRSIAAGYLNRLEVVAAAWLHKIADRQIIEDEFKKVIEPKPNNFVLESFRLATGIYPSLGKLVEHIKQKAGTQPRSQPPSG